MNKADKSARLLARAQKVTPGGVHSPVRAFKGVGGTPVFVESADKCWLHDVDGNRYLDFCMSWGPLLLGHCDPDVSAAVQAAISRGSSFGTAEPISLELAELIVAQIPWVEKIRFVNSGTEAVMSALRVARAATGRDRIVKFAGCYHGHSDAMLVQAGSGLTELAVPDSAGVPQGTSSDTLVAPLDDLAAVEQLFAKHGSSIAAVIIEPVPANNGLLMQQKNYLAELAAIARRHGALVIFDEVITGFRLAFGGAAEVFGVEPDLVTYGKIIGGGFPVGAYGGRAELLDLVAPEGDVYQAGTLSANPVAMSAGLATLSKLLQTEPWADLATRTRRLGDRIEAAAGDFPLQVQTAGSLFWLVLGDVTTADGVVRTPEQAPAGHRESYQQLFHGLLERGYYLAPSAFEVGFLSTVHGSAELDAFADAVGAALK